MRGSIIAGEIIAEQRRKEYFSKKAMRKTCMIDAKKQCNKCKYQYICEENGTGSEEYEVL